ncbi:MAG TPA: SDR family oxidoreductase [Pseudomonadales bacterium]|jgi:NAD(P)-dependent dehydrogenase (short-subunit alcohol dehydrogenase family)|nr:3-oxoacyl-ACP reductase [Gammaproteobacteria bacterium]MDP6026694.1 SDR family oxidoreductase [Pseudomonadales bacterium]MDP7450897.1 SDR family oxidoreductase [Arenicellales bacterium]MDP7315384.1 SDR family oxidoreductase [Pseudomonadales bacterium]MDP7576340.1 SDR family oxidoreductase [Pseudomonadales bacterium]|tara:strand:+ start:10040 stop:10855 length:816 start_codon:yes stop_codon:yes gene_type:complete
MNFEELFSVLGKVVCVTGGGGGIGRGIAKTFVAGGAKVYIASRSDLSEVAAEISGEGPGECLSLPLDISQEESIKALVANLKEQEGKLDVLVNNAALGNFIHPFEEFPMDEWDQMTTVNLRGPFLLVKEALNLLESAGSPEAHASVINIASVDGIRVARDNDWAYGASKAALIQLTRQWASTLGNNYGREGGRQITFNTIAPGPFPGMLDQYLETEEGRAAVASATVVGRVGDPVDVGAACAYLASRAGSYVTGSTIPVDGGLLVGRRANS